MATSTLLAAITLMALCLGACATNAYAEEAPDVDAVSFPGGPMTVYVGPRGQCQSSYSVGSATAGNYFPGGEPFEFSPVGDCGFILAFPGGGLGQPAALQEQTFGFSGHAGPRGLGLYTPVSQSPVVGTGTESQPYTETTVFKVVDFEGEDDALITETTTYVNGTPEFTSNYKVHNTSAGTLYFRAIYAGDLYVNGDDFGRGSFIGGPPRFVGGQNTGSGVLGGFQEAPAPALPWSSFQEACWIETPSDRCEGAAPEDDGIWRDVETNDGASSTFNESIDPGELDNGTGVEWDQLRESGLAPGAQQDFTIVNRTQIPNGLQIRPVNQALTQGQTETVTVSALDTANQPYAGRSVRYSVVGANTQSGSVSLNSSGQATISYVGNNAGTDTIQMYVDLGGGAIQTSSDPAGTATATFVPRPPTPNSTYKVQSIKANPDGTITIVFVPTQEGTAKLEVTVPTGTISRNPAVAARTRKCKHNQIKIKGKCHPKTTFSGTVSANGKAGVPLKLTVKPSSKVKKALSKGKIVQLTAKLTYKSGLGGIATVQTFHLKVKGKKRHHLNAAGA